MPDKFTILAVDDQTINFDLIKLALKDEYHLEFMTGGKECLDNIENINPDLVLMDIEMPDINGYDVCRELKDMTSPISDTPVIFISAKDTMEERLASYEAGGEDFILKPFDSAELSKKVTISINNKQEREKLKADVSDAYGAVMTALTMSSELGIIINFLTSCTKCDDFESLGEALITSLTEYGLNSALQITYNGQTLNMDVDKVTRPLEAAILTKMHDQGRMIDFGPRTVMNYEHISVLFKNMPIDDEEKIGRYKDNLALIVEGADARIKGIISESTVKKQEEALFDLVENTRSTLTELEQKNQKKKKANTQIMSNMVTDVLASFVGLDLSDFQEAKLMNIIDTSADKAKALFNEEIEADDKITEIMDQIESALK